MFVEMKNGGDFHLQLYASSPAPKRDYHGLTITNKYIILNSWDISHGPHVYPKRRQVQLVDLLFSSSGRWFRNDLQNLFGKHVIEYLERIAGEDPSLYSLPERVFRRLIDFLAVGDIVRLGQTSKIFFELCNTNIIWKIIFQKNMKRPPTQSELNLSEKMSWRHMLHRRFLDKSEQKRISDNFKKGVEKLQEQNKIKGDKIRQKSQMIEPLIEKVPNSPKKCLKNFKFPTNKVEPIDANIKTNKSTISLVNEKKKMDTPKKSSAYFKSKSIFM